jgi:hypothetical protein
MEPAGDAALICGGVRLLTSSANRLGVFAKKHSDKPVRDATALAITA